MSEKTVTLTECEIDHIKQALICFYSDEEHGWCTECESIAKKLGFESPE